MLAEANFNAELARQQLAADIRDIETANAQAEAINSRAGAVLKVAAGAPADLNDDEDAWHVWWYDSIGYRYQVPEQITVAQNATPQQGLSAYPTITTCFVAGTPVETLSGPRPIEAIQVGDQVLSQNAASGELGFQPVVRVHHNRPDKTLRVLLSSGDSVACSVYHRFWRSGRGWAMVRELAPGDVLRGKGGLVSVKSVKADEAAPLFNLDVAGSRTFFAGKTGLLVHDNTLPEVRLVPFDALPDLEAGRAPAE